MEQKSLKSTEAKINPPKNDVVKRRGFLRFLALFGIGGGVGMLSSKAHAGLFDSLLNVVKRILQAAVAGIALFYAWRFLMHSGEAIKDWLSKQVDNEKKNQQDDVVIQAKFADYVNMGKSVVENAEIVAMYDTPDDACDLTAMSTVSSMVGKRKGVTAKKVAAEIAFQQEMHRSDDNILVRKTKIKNIREKSPEIRKNVDLLISRRGFLEEEKPMMTDLLQVLLGSIHDNEDDVTPKNMDVFTAKQHVRLYMTEIYSRRVKHSDIVDDFINAQTSESSKELARAISKDGLSHVDVLNFDAQRYGLSPFNIFSIQQKPHPTPIYKKLVSVRASQNALVKEYHDLVKKRKKLVAMQNIIAEKRMS